MSSTVIMSVFADWQWEKGLHLTIPDILVLSPVASDGLLGWEMSGWKGTGCGPESSKA